MAVNLSPVGGVAAQFFDNAGNVLTGGKLYTYAAGTTTPQNTYTTSVGNVPWSNPIILDAAGRVSGSGEIWLLDGTQYKFILRDSNDVLIATYDNVVGINSNFVNFTNEQEIQTATAGQTVFNLTTVQYSPGTNSLTVFVDGVNQYGPGAQYAYLETDSDTVTFVNGLHVGALVKFTTSQLNSSGAVDAQQVSYVAPYTNAISSNVENKLSYYIHVKDFGAVGDGITDDTVAIQNACNYLQSIGGGCLDFGGANDTYSIFNGTYNGSVVYPGPNFGEVARLGNFDSLDGVEIRSSGAKLVSNGAFPLDARRITLFYFLDCNNVTIGDFYCDYTGNRDYPTDPVALYRRGLVFALFQGDCSNIRGGNLIANNFTFGWAFQALVQGVNLEIESRNVNIDSVKCYQTGYAYFCNGGGHSAHVGIVDTDECGRSCTLQDVQGGVNVTIKSKNHQASNDVGLAGWSDGAYVKYINTESDAGVELGNCVTLAYPTLADSPNRVTKNVTFDLDISANGSTFFGKAFTCGLSIGVNGADIDPNYILDGLTVTGRIDSDTAAMVPIRFDYPSAWSLGQNLFNINVQNLSVPYNGTPIFDLRGVATTATISNFRCNSIMQLQGNTVGRIVCVNCIAGNPFGGALDLNDTFISFVNCSFTDNFSIVASRRYMVNTEIEGRATSVNTWMDGIYQVFTLAITNDAGTLKHQIIGDWASTTLPRSCTRIIGASATLAATPTVNSTTNFVSGVGILDGFENQIAFDVENQNTYSVGINLAAFVERYDGNVSVPSVSAIRNFFNVDGSSIVRVHLSFYNALSGAAWNINTTNIPSGKTIWIKFLGYIL